MSAPINGTPLSKTPDGPTQRVPRRIVLLKDGEHGDVETVLAEFEGAQVSGRKLHDEVRRLADAHPGRHVAAEWKGPLGWTRFLWRRR